MFEVRVEAEFAAAHFLKNYDGKCESLHGHNYRVLAYARGIDLDAEGMLLDFTKFKKALRKVCSELDHTNLNEREAFEQNPTAERISFWIFWELARQLAFLDGNNESAELLYRVDVFETPTSRASYCRD